MTRIVTFHDILPEAVEPFRAKLRFLKQSTNVVTLDEYIAGRLCVDRINTVITFDDGYKSWTTRAVPALRSAGLPATFFVSSGFVGLSERDELEFLKSRLCVKLGPKPISGCLSHKDLRRIVEEGYSVGGHTANHCNLAEVSDREQIEREISGDKQRLEALTGNEVRFFSYPGGNFFNPIVNIESVLRAAGYAGAVTTVPGFNTAETNPYFLNRDLTGTSMPGIVFRARVLGNYDGVRLLKKWTRAAVGRSMGV